MKKLFLCLLAIYAASSRAADPTPLEEVWGQADSLRQYAEFITGTDMYEGGKGKLKVGPEFKTDRLMHHFSTSIFYGTTPQIHGAIKCQHVNVSRVTVKDFIIVGSSPYKQKYYTPEFTGIAYLTSDEFDALFGKSAITFKTAEGLIERENILYNANADGRIINDVKNPSEMVIGNYSLFANWWSTKQAEKAKANDTIKQQSHDKKIEQLDQKEARK